MARALVQDDGNFVLYDYAGAAYWSTMTTGLTSQTAGPRVARHDVELAAVAGR